MTFRHGWAFGALLLAASSGGAMAQTVTALTNLIPYDGIVYGFLLTDGTILYQGGLLQDWYKFTPDQNGSYLNGTFQSVAALPPDYVPYATSGGVLPDGRVLLIGGEYLIQAGLEENFVLTNKMAIYDPIADTWTEIKPPAGWGFIGDSPWTILANGQLMLGHKLDRRAAILDPTTLTWTPTATTGKRDFNAEEGWTLLPDGSVLTVDVLAHPHTERFLPNANPLMTGWVSAGSTPNSLAGGDEDDNGTNPYAIPFDNGKMTYYPPGEVGPAILRPDGTVFATGAVCAASDCTTVTTVGYTAIYTPGTTPTAPGTWAAGPTFPGGVGAGDSFASLLPSGNVLVEANPAGSSNSALARLARIQSGKIRPAFMAPAASAEVAASTPTWKFFEFDGTKLIAKPSADFTGGPASTLLLPTGEVMLNGQAIYAPAGTYSASWAPVVTHAPTTVSPGHTYAVSGQQFNGLSQANAYGDEFAVATNYPLVRITNGATGHVFYARTHDHSSMGVATGKLVVSTHFDVPRSIETGASQLVVVANGIPSAPVAITVE